MRVNLACPFDEKDQAKALGARWDAARKTWYIEDVEDLTPFMRWIARKEPAPTEETITLAAYLKKHYGNGSKALTHEAAKTFGIPFPLEKGWTKTYASRRITLSAMANIKHKTGKKMMARGAPETLPLAFTA